MGEPGILETPHSVAWQAVEYLAAKNAKDMDAPQRNLPFILVAWFNEVALFNQAENDQIIGVTPTVQVQQAHQHILAMLIWQGEGLVALLREHDVRAQAGLTLADLEARLEELYDRQRARYGGMTEERRAQILDEVFGERRCLGHFAVALPG